MRSYAINVSGPLILNWTNSESVRNTSKFWLEVKANGTSIEIDCEPRTTTTKTSSTSSATTTTLSTKYLTSISAPIAKTDVNPSTSVASRTSTIPEQSENTVSYFLGTSSPPTKYVSRLGVTPDGGHTKETKSTLENDGGSKFPVLPVVIGLVLLLIIVIICVAIAIYIKKKKAKQKVQNTDDKDELADSNNDEDKTETNSYEETAMTPSNTKFTAAATLIPATQFPPLSNQVPAVRSTPYDAIDQQNVRGEEENEVTEERKKKKKKKKKKRKKKNAVFPEEEWDIEPQIFQEETDNVTLGDNIDDN